ncbi:DMT family transporter [Gorillibacterium timonense]|uniref:hypothetical protein n=1 Tax=Gorillibacterium timonense TaxID=1689269 RepID=UPI00071CF3A8|nr:hypothetical protein [Gorillibacterium timonense]
MSVIFMIISVLFNICAQVVLKHGLNMVELKGIDIKSFSVIVSSPFIWLGATIYGLSFFVYLLALSKGELGRLSIGAQGLTIIGLLLVSLVIFHEPFTTGKVAGVCFVLVGIFFIFR